MEMRNRRVSQAVHTMLQDDKDAGAADSNISQLNGGNSPDFLHSFSGLLCELHFLHMFTVQTQLHKRNLILRSCRSIHLDNF
jgi:hypothetical protein